MRRSVADFHPGKNFFIQILFVLGMGIILLAVFLLILTSFAITTQEINVNRTFYFLALEAEEETVFVLSKDAYIGGSAGYSFVYQNSYYIVLAAYPNENSAKNVQTSLEKKGKETKIIPLKIEKLYFTNKSQRQIKEGTEGCVHTLLQCITLLYNTANGVDTAQYTQEEARTLFGEIKSVLKQLRNNASAYTQPFLAQAVKKCDEIQSGIIYAKDIRYLQIFLCESLYNLQKVFHN